MNGAARAPAAATAPPGATVTAAAGTAGTAGTGTGSTAAAGAAGAGGAAAAVVADRFDRFTWSDTRAQSAGLRELAAELTGRHAGAGDLLTDVFLAAYKAGPRVREAAEMDATRLVNHRIVTELVESAEFTELRRETVGDPYAAAMAVLALAGALRRMLERGREAQDLAVRAAAGTAGDRGAAARDRDDDSDGDGDGDGDRHESPGDGPDPDDAAGEDAAPDPAAADAAQRAAEAADAAARALAAAVPGIRGEAGNAAAKAARAAREEAALMRSWGVSGGELERMPFDGRARLAERLRTGRLAQWSELIGRFRQMAAAERARKVENTTGELVGVTLGDDLSRIVPSELASLGLPELRAVFAARYAAGELMLFDSQGEQNTGRGAVVACVDTSHSMYAAGPGGVTREAWAKACALALLDQARAAGRDFVGILFSAADRIQVFRFPAAEPAGIARTLDFAESFLGGGTSYQAPLTVAADLLAAEYDDASRMRGDIVMITDDECGVTERWTRDWNDAKRRLGFRVFGVAVGAPRAAAAGSVLEALCDNLRSVEDFTDVHAAADLFRVI
ncbi:VWA domain-containing protein [Streptomyces carpaticus]|uniref:VWA domain-containing protein n=1 Tax=Streptomyces carpaticus TaxID=285558 RepID=UPI0031F8D720